MLYMIKRGLMFELKSPITISWTKFPNFLSFPNLKFFGIFWNSRPAKNVVLVSHLNPSEKKPLIFKSPAFRFCFQSCCELLSQTIPATPAHSLDSRQKAGFSSRQSGHKLCHEIVFFFLCFPRLPNSL